MTPHNRRVLKTVVAALFVLMLAGVTYQGVATALERRAFRYPGRLVPVGDHQLHIHCVGTGSPTVVLDAPAIGFSASWSLLQGGLSEVTRVCSYDRAGLGWSEAREGAFDPRAVPEELHTLLANAGERPPFLIVGAQLGAAYARLFAARFPGDTVALVELDPVRPADGLRNRVADIVAPSPWLARTGVLRLSRAMSGQTPLLPGPSGGAVEALTLRPDHLTRSAVEIGQLARILDLADAADLAKDLTITRQASPSATLLIATEDGARGVRETLTQLVQRLRP